MLQLGLRSRRSEVDYSEHGYQFVETVGRGQFGAAHLVTDTHDQQYIVKVCLIVYCFNILFLLVH